MVKYPALFFLGYLIEKGFNWSATDSSGLKVADILSHQGYSKEAIEALERFSRSTQNQSCSPSAGTSCMGQHKCIQPPKLGCVDDNNVASVSGAPRHRPATRSLTAWVIDRLPIKNKVVDRDDVDDHQDFPAMDRDQVINNNCIICSLLSILI